MKKILHGFCILAIAFGGLLLCAPLTSTASAGTNVGIFDRDFDFPPELVALNKMNIEPVKLRDYDKMPSGWSSLLSLGILTFRSRKRLPR